MGGKIKGNEFAIRKMVNFKKKSRSQSSMMSNTTEMKTESIWIYQQNRDYWSKTNGHSEGNQLSPQFGTYLLGNWTEDSELYVHCL